MIILTGVVLWQHYATGNGRPTGSSITEFTCEEKELVSHLNGEIEKRKIEKSDTVFCLTDYKITNRFIKRFVKRS